MPISSFANGKAQRPTSLTEPKHTVQLATLTSSNHSSTHTVGSAKANRVSFSSNTTNTASLGDDSPARRKSLTGEAPARELRSPTRLQSTPTSRQHSLKSQHRAATTTATPTSLKELKQRYGSVESKIGSLDNIKHKPKPPTNKILHAPLKIEAASKVGSLDNIKHKPKPPTTKILHAPLKLEASSKVGSLDNIKHKPKPPTAKIIHAPLKVQASSKVGSLDNIKHKPKPSTIKIHDEPLKIEANSKIGSLDNIKHKPKQSTIKIHDQPLKIEASAKVGSLDNIKHKPTGTVTGIFSEKLAFKEQAKPLIDAGERKRSSRRSSSAIIVASPNALTPSEASNHFDSPDMATPPHSPSNSEGRKQQDTTCSVVDALEAFKI